MMSTPRTSWENSFYNFFIISATFYSITALKRKGSDSYSHIVSENNVIICIKRKCSPNVKGKHSRCDNENSSMCSAHVATAEVVVKGVLTKGILNFRNSM